MARKPEIIPISPFPPPTKKQQKRYAEIQRLVKLMRVHEPRVEEPDIYNAWIDAVNDIGRSNSKLVEDAAALRGKEKEASEEDGSVLALSLITFYHLRAIRFARERTFAPAYNDKESAVMRSIVDQLMEHPLRINSAAHNMDIVWDVMSTSFAASPLGRVPKDQAVMLANMLYTQSVHPNFDLPEGAKD